MRVVATVDTRAAVRGEEKSWAREIETYEIGRDELHAQIPDGWQMLGIGGARPGRHLPASTALTPPRSPAST